MFYHFFLSLRYTHTHYIEHPKCTTRCIFEQKPSKEELLQNETKKRKIYGRKSIICFDKNLLSIFVRFEES